MRLLVRDFYRIFYVIVTLIFCSMLVESYYVNQRYKKEKDLLYQNQSKQISEAFEEPFNYITHFFDFIAKSITLNRNTNLQEINKLLAEKSVNIADQFYYSWTLFNWFDQSNKLVVNTIRGIVTQPLDMTNKEYIKKLKEMPWKPIYGSPEVGIPSSQWEIPVAMGVTTDLGNYVGAISIGINIKKLEERIYRVMKNNSIEFIITDLNLKPIIWSKSVNLDKEALQKILSDKSSDNIQKQSLALQNVNIEFYKNLPSKPYILFLGQNKLIQKSQTYELVMNIFEGKILLLISLFLIFYFFRRAIVFPLSELSKNLSVDQINNLIRNTGYQEIKSLYKQYIRNQELQKENTLIKAEMIELSSNLESKVLQKTQYLKDQIKSKVDFINNLSHEIRTPIQGVTAISSGLVEHWHDLEDTKKLKLASDVLFNANRLFDLVNRLLDSSKFSSGKMQFEFRRYNILSIIKEIVNELKPIYQKKENLSIKIQNKLSFNPITEMDKNRIAQVLRNLLSNSIKFSTEGTITITVSLIQKSDNDSSYLQVTISDEGIGVPVNELKSIFSAFIQSTRTQNIGTGLGLYISAEIIRAHNGEIWAENNKSKGASFHFTLPIVKSEIVESNKQLITKSQKIDNTAKNIVLIDDEESCYTSLNLMLRKTEYNLIWFYEPQVALEYIKHNSNTISAVLIDLNMPDTSGVEVIKILNSNIETAKIPVILQTGTTNDADIEEAVELGIKLHVTKPYKKDHILSALNAVIDKSL